MEIDIRGAIEDCTEAKMKVYYATIRGRIYISRKGRVCFVSKSALVQSILYWSTWQRAIRTLALEQFAFHNPGSTEYSWGTKNVKAPFRKEFEKFEEAFMRKAFESEIEIKEITLPE